MRQKLLFALLSSLASFAVPLAGQQQAGPTAAPEQPDTNIRRFEVGGAFPDIRTSCIVNHCPTFGGGFGAAMNLDRHFAVDANLNFVPGAALTTNLYGGRLSEYLIGARAEVRSRHYGYFIKAQPGVLNWDHVITQVVYPTPTTFAFNFGSVNKFVSVMGGGFEYSPIARIHMRVEVSDLLMRFGPGAWENSLQPTVGVYVGLGKPIAWTPPVYDAKKSHRFFDRENEALITASVLGMTADGITTQRVIARGGVEGDPLARPLVKYGWSGQISLEALEAGAEIAGMYGLHRIGKHWLERLVPGIIAAAHGYYAYGNDQH